MKMRLQGFDFSQVDWPYIAEESRGLSHAEIIAAAEDAARNSILDHGPEILSADLYAAIVARRNQEH